MGTPEPPKENALVKRLLVEAAQEDGVELIDVETHTLQEVLDAFGRYWPARRITTTMMENLENLDFQRRQAGKADIVDDEEKALLKDAISQVQAAQELLDSRQRALHDYYMRPVYKRIQVFEAATEAAQARLRDAFNEHTLRQRIQANIRAGMDRVAPQLFQRVLEDDGDEKKVDPTPSETPLPDTSPDETTLPPRKVRDSHLLSNSSLIQTV